MSLNLPAFMTIYISIERIDDEIREITIKGDERFADIGN